MTNNDDNHRGLTMNDICHFNDALEKNAANHVPLSP